MTQRLSGLATVFGALVLATAAGHASPQVVMTSRSQGGPPPDIQRVLGELQVMPGMPGANAKPMEVGGGLIVGRAVDGVEGSGVSGAIVTLTLAGFTPVRVQADSDGRFAFRGLPTGSFTISTSRPGFVDGASGRTRPGGPGRSVTLTADQRMGDVDIPMWRFAAVTGIVLDEDNEPLVGVQVRVLRRDYVAGQRRLTLGATDTTDDRGHYRITALTAGDYLVAVPIVQRPSLDQMMGGLRDGAMAAGGGGGAVAMTREVRVVATASVAAGGAAPMIMSSLDGAAPPAGTTEEGLPLTYQTSFYPGAVTAARATPITLTHGEERTGVDFTMIPVRALAISGTVSGPDGPASNVQLQLIPAAADDVVSPIETATANTDGDGHFTFAMVPAGQYTLRALRQPRGGGETFAFTSAEGGATMTVRATMVERAAQAAPLPDTPALWAEMPIGVGTRDLADVGVTLRTGLTVSGTVVFSGSATQPTQEQRSNLMMSLEPADNPTAGLTSMVRGRVDANGTFTTMGVPAGKYILRVSGAPQGWTLRDASHNGRDITSMAVDLDADSATGVVLTFTDKPSELNGTVRDASGNPDLRASVLVFPTDSAGWIDTGSQPRRLRQVRAGQDGSFRITGLPSGDYYLVAVDDATIGSWQAPEFLRELAREATTVRLADGDTRTQGLTTLKGGR